MSAYQRILSKIRTRQHPKTIVTTANATVDYADALYGGVVVSNKGASGTITITLPEAVPGMRVSAIVLAAQQLRLDPAGSESIALPSTGVQGTGGKYLVADAASESIDLICLVAGSWDVLNFNGTFTAEP